MTKKFKLRIVGLLMAIITVFAMPMSAFAAEVETPVSVEPRAGVETFWLDKTYDVGSFTFKNNNTTPTKTVQGRYLYTFLEIQRASSDQGIASTPIKVTVDILDASTREVIDGIVYYLNTTDSLSHGFEVDLGYAGRQICYRFDASSYNGPTNGYYRSATVKQFVVNTSNTEGVYWN